MSNLSEHARNELQKAGLFDLDSDYKGMLGTAVMDLIDVFAEQGHSGFSAHITIKLFTELAQYHNITPLTSDGAEWNQVGLDTWQNRRRSTTFSRDGGTTWYDIEDPTGNNGDTWHR